MYSEEELDSAIKAGVISSEAVDAFRAHVSSIRQTSIVDNENFRLITGFNDIFVVIAVGLLLASLSQLGSIITPWLSGLAVSGTSWGLAEFFTRKKRMALPSIVLLLSFIGGVFAFIYFLVKGQNFDLTVASALAAMSAWLHWLRFHVAITVAAGVSAIVCLIISGLLILVPQIKPLISIPTLIFGIIVFVYALWWDSSDVKRQTNRSDVAFWLHLLAAPLIIHPIFTELGVFENHIGNTTLLIVLILYVIIAIVSLAVDRRALMVSALGYVIFAFTTLLKQNGVISQSFAVTSLIIGSALLLLSAFWRPCREYVLKLLPEKIRLKLASPQ